MSRRGRNRRASLVHGVLLVDKPEGPTSHDVVQWARRAFGTSRVGHTGTLDPFASGLLPLALGAATSLVPYLTDTDKGYIATLELGVETDTGDLQGEVVSRSPLSGLDAAAVRAALASFEGPLQQIPPQHAAIKVGGRRLYEYARRGEHVEVAARDVVAQSLTLLAFDPPRARIEVACTKGFYVRALARDLGRALGVGAHLTALRRTAVGRMTVQAAVEGEALRAADAGDALAASVLSPAAALAHLPRVCLDEGQVLRVRQGKRLEADEVAWPSGEGAAGAAGPPDDAPVVALDPAGALVAMLALSEGRWRVLRGYVEP